MLVNAGDTVVWLDQAPTNYLESYGGDWKSPPMTNGDSFAFTFTNAGFYAYRTGLGIIGATASGTVTVNAWSDVPPPVTINSPVDGTTLASTEANILEASATNEANLAATELFANGTSIGAVSNAPHAIQ